MKKILYAADLYAGAGGTSTGLVLAAKTLGRKVDLTAVNHWKTAVRTHEANYPWAKHLQADVEAVNPLEAIPGGHLDILVASPECIHHSRAAGGRPKNEQKRASAWAIFRWLEFLRVDSVLVENVPEFCFVAGTMVWTEFGAIPIEEVKSGMLVLTHKGRWKKVLSTSSKTATTIKVSGVLNPTIQCIPSHQFWARERRVKITKSGQFGRHVLQLGEPKWVEANDLPPINTTTYSEKYSGYMWATPCRTEPLPIPSPPKGFAAATQAFWNMVGRWLGDGWIRRRKDRKNFRIRICEDIEKAHVLEEELKGTELHWSKDVRKKVVVFETTNHSLAIWLIEHFGEHAENKTIPAWVLSLPDFNREALIKGYVSADGEVRVTGRSFAVTVSKKLAIGLKMLVQSLGVPAGMGTLPPTNSILNGRPIKGNGAYWISWKTNANFYECTKDDNHFWSKVQETEDANTQQVFEITVEDDESFVADGVVVHNCTWGPLDAHNQPVKLRRGEIYRAWLEAFRAHGYTVETKVLNAANFGAPTSRSRLFIAAILGKKRPAWPVPTHSKEGWPVKKWRSAREIIDWSIKGTSIFNRKKPLSPRTIQRITEGLRRFGGRELQPFIILMEHGGGIRNIDEPLPTITTAKGGAMALANPEPFILSQGSTGAPRTTKDPMPTIVAKGAHALVEPFLVSYHDTSNRFGLAEPCFLVPNFGEHDVARHGAGAIVEPFLLPVEGFFHKEGQNKAKSLNKPLGAITQRGGGNLVEPFLVKYNGTGGAKSVEEPLDTISTKDRFGLAEPQVRNINDPLPDIANHFALVQPEINGCVLDIRFRMLQPHELASATGFPTGYKFLGTKTDIVRQIGNAVVVDIAKALCLSLLSTKRARRC